MAPPVPTGVAPADAPVRERPAPGALDAAASSPDERPTRRGTPRWLGPALLAVLVAPLLVAVAALRQPRWFPILDLAMTELRVRDVGGPDTPLIGLPGRIGVLGAEQGSHPGPLSFWALAPGYRLFGSSAWAMEAATVLLHALAMGAALWIAHRRAGVRAVLAVAAVLAVLTRGYGPGLLTEPWNPYLPLLWWFVVLLAVWSVLDDDLAPLPVAVFAASMCAQTHAPYLGLVGGMGALALLGVAFVARRRRGERGGGRHIALWVGGSVALGAALWAGPVVDQLTVEPGNVDLLVDHFGSPPEEAVGLAKGVEMTLLHLDPWRLATGQDAATGSLVDASQAPAGALAPGAVVLLAWAASVLVAVRLRHRLLVRLHVVAGVALALGVISISRIFGQLWYYLMIWAWGTAALVVLATGWTVAAAVARGLDGDRRASVTRAGGAALAGVTLLAAATFAVDAASAEVPALPLSRTMASLVPDTVATLDDGALPDTGPDARYLVTWTDALYIGSQGIALVNELERAGFDVGAVRPWGVPVARHRIRTPEEADALVHLATGFHVERWRDKPGMVEVATIDPRTPEQREEYADLRALVLDELRSVGMDDRLVDVDENLFAVAIDSRATPAAQDAMTRMLDLGLPTSVFVGPPSQAE